MKICAIICEFNPFHNGHRYVLDKARALSGCDALVCIMSGSFTQRGDICVADKYTRARHAVTCGADCVLELPTAFSVAPAEIFAKGAVKIFSSVPEIDTLAFGCEGGAEADFLSAARLLTDESGNFKAAMKKSLDAGESYAKSYAAAFEVAGGAAGFLSTPNNILGVEYSKAFLSTGKNIRLLPIKRVGAGFNDGEIKANFSSATAIRKNVSSPLVKDNVPEAVFEDLTDFSAENARFESFLRLILSRTSVESLSEIYGCGDGLENALKALQALPYAEIVSGATSKRYPSARIKRILLANFLGLYRKDCEEYLRSALYLFPLAVKKESADGVLSALSKSEFPVLTCGADELKLGAGAADCKKKDDFAYLQWLQITERKPNKKMLII